MIGLLNNSCTVWRHGVFRDSAGGIVVNNTGYIVAFNIRCRIEDAKSSQILEYGTRRIDITHVVFSFFPGFQNGMSVRAQDGRRYRITANPKRRKEGGLPDFWAMGAVEIEPPANAAMMGLVICQGKVIPYP